MWILPCSLTTAWLTSRFHASSEYSRGDWGGEVVVYCFSLCETVLTVGDFVNGTCVFLGGFLTSGFEHIVLGIVIACVHCYFQSIKVQFLYIFCHSIHASLFHHHPFSGLCGTSPCFTYFFIIHPRFPNPQQDDRYQLHSYCEHYHDPCRRQRAN